MNRLIPILALAPALIALPVFAAPSWEADVRYSGGTLTGSPGRQHRAANVAMDVIETENCNVGSHAGGQLRLPDSCGFVRGLYRYTFRDERKNARQVLVEFTATKHGGTAHAFLVAEPIVIAAED